MHAPSPCRVTERGAIRSTRRTGGAGDQLIGGAVTASTRTGRAAPGRAVKSVVWPFIRSAATTVPRREVQSAPVTATVSVPSA